MSIPRRMDTADVVCRSHPMTFGGKELTLARAAVRMDLSNARLSEGAGTRCYILYDPCTYVRLLTKAGLERQRAEQGFPCPRGGEGTAHSSTGGCWGVMQMFSLIIMIVAQL